MIRKIRNKLIALGLVIIIVDVLTSHVSAAASHTWYIKRRGGERPDFPSDACELAKYNAYYIDEKASTMGDKKIYLTFDAGYENGNVERILNTLRDNGVPAAFFILDNLIYKNPELIVRMQNEGHLVCNHTKNHKNLTAKTKEEIEEDLSALETVCLEQTGVHMSKYFRYPEGKYSIDSLKSINELGYKTVFWSFAYADWDNRNQPDKEKAIKKITDNTHPGEIILLHPTSDTNAEILETLICTWREMGYSFGTLDELVISNS